MSSDARISTGQENFSYGVDSSKPPLIQSARNPNGLPNNALAWLTNGTVRGGAIQPRYGLQPLCEVDATGDLYQGGILYDQSMLPGEGNPYLLLSIGGRMLQVRVDTDNSVHDVTNGFNDPPDEPQAYFAQGEQFAIKQAGDGVTLPLFWDGTTMRRSLGESYVLGVTANNPNFTIPAAGGAVLVTLTSPYTGVVNEIINIYAGTQVFQFIQVVTGNFVTLQNEGHSNTGDTVPSGTQVLNLTGGVIGTLLAPVTVPALGSTVVAFVAPVYTLGNSYVGATILGEAWNIKKDAPANPTANQVYLVSLTGPAYPTTTIALTSTLYSVQELPAATSMIYYQGILWYAQNRTYSGGDIVDGPSGTIAYNFTDSILKVTENPLALGGDGFSVPANSGNITAFGIPLSLDQTLGQGPLFVFTNKQIWALTVPNSRQAWISAGANNLPTQVLVMNKKGTVSERSVVACNGDLFYSTGLDIRSYFMALRYFETWGNGPISNNVNRILQFNDLSLMHVAPGIEFQSRVLQGVLPVTTPVGIGFTSIISLDADPLSTLQNQNPPAWEGDLEGQTFLQLFEGDFGGQDRAFAVVCSQATGAICVWEITDYQQSDNANNSPLATGDKRIQWYFETPAFDFSEYPAARGGGPFALKELDGLDLWLDDVFGNVLVKVQFRPDEDACWYDWFTTKVCSARNSAEDKNNPISYPLELNNPGYRMPISAPKPTNSNCSVGNQRPVTLGYKFQLRISITGWCRVRGFHLHCLPRDSSPFYHMIEC